MSEYIYDVTNKTSKLDWSFPFQRVDSFPLDRTSLFSSLNDAKAYALGLDENGNANDSRKLAGASYVGQSLSVFDEEKNSISFYVIEGDRSLREIGSMPGDDSSIEIVDDQLQIKGFGSGYYKYNPETSDYDYTEGFKEGLEPRVASIEGKLVVAWYESNIDELTSMLEDLSNEIGQAASDGKEATGLYALLDAKANKSDVYTKEQTLEEIAKSVAASGHLKRKTVVSVDSIDLDAIDADLYVYMVPNKDGNYDEYMVVNGELEKVGDWNVDLSEYAKTTDVVTLLNAKVDKDENARLMTLAEGNKLATIQSGAEKNFISSVSSGNFEVLEGLLSLKSVEQSKVSGLAEALNKKVDAVENARLMTNEEADKLAQLKDLIKSVDTAKFTVNNDGKLLLNDIEIKEVSGLEALLNNKVDKVEGSRLITSEEAKKLESLSVGEDGSVGISGTVNASKVQELYSAVTNIVTGTGTGEYDGEQKPLLGIVAGAEKNFINSTSEAEFTVEDRRLSVKSIEMLKVNGLIEALNNKAPQKEVTDLSTLLNNKVSEYNDRLDTLENRLTWKSLS